ncbi:chaperonin Cpn60/TCP-1 family [Suillus paluster]|uniref:chaperonin Cpn60/TCP-1 family n=1 Tax=Suillus paluster TaxID=48578 RepID=UPI001B86E7E7|nr:chaperonin Cpn60/TCP-1 family [Suillus paluster]KAG1731975.1 chaperonin Cpn60/TCP-1 family [Suillus paluster]
MSMHIFGHEATEEKAENARLSSFVGALALGDLVKSTLGPKGMNKILQSASSGDINVTNDGATILKSIQLDNAAAKILVNISKVQDDEVGDGTTTVCVLAAELLREAERLIAMKIHPQTIVEGYRVASIAALAALENCSSRSRVGLRVFRVSLKYLTETTWFVPPNSSDPAQFRQDLVNIARTTLSSKVLSQDKNYFANLAVDAVLRLKGSTDLEHIQIIKKVGGKLTDSYLDEGFILDKTIAVNSPKRMENAKILIANTSMDTDKIKIFGARVKVDSTGKLAELERAEREKMKAKVDAIAAHGINCFVNRQLIYNYPESLLAEKGIMVIEHADFEGVERLSLVTGGEIASTFDRPDLVKLGKCDLIEEIIIGEDKLIKFSGVAAGEACTVVLRGSTNQMVDEAERSLHDALSVLSQTVKETRIVLGGGCSEMLMSCAVEEAARKVKGKKAIAAESFSRALRQIPTILADNAGYDSSDLVAKLRAAHYEGQSDAGLDMNQGTIGSMRQLGVTESYKLKRQVVLSASEAAEMIIRVDDILRATPRRREAV